MALAAADITRSVREERAGSLMDDLRTMMEGEMGEVETRCETYLRWYSPEYNELLGSHDAWRDPITYEDIDTTRASFPICRAVVDLWSSLEAAKPPTVRAEAERVRPPRPTSDPAQALIEGRNFDLAREMESSISDIRSARIRRMLREDMFALKHHTAVRRKNLYGFSWMQVLPQPWRKSIRSTVLRNPTTVYPLWSASEPDELEAVFSAQQIAARRAHALWPQLAMRFEPGSQRVTFERGEDSGRYRAFNDRWYDRERTLVWVEDLWWIDRTYDAAGRQTGTKVHHATRVLDQMVAQQSFDWPELPFVYWENTDERGSWGWSDIAGVIDINDEFNRRVSQEGDVIRLFSAPRFQLLGSMDTRQVDLPRPFGLIPLNETERIEQILTRIDVFPTQAHFDILTDLLHRVSGLPPIVWGLINNAQTSGRALSASWKATEARLLPKLMRNEQSCRKYLDIILGYARHYDWYGARETFRAQDDSPFDDFVWTFPPMEPRDFTEVTMNEITKRDAGLTSTIRAMRAIGIEDAEVAFEEVMQEFGDVNVHPDKVNAKLLAQAAELDNIQRAQAMQQPAAPGATPGGAPAGPPPGLPAGPAAPPEGNMAPPGMEAGLPPTTEGAPGNAGVPSQSITGGTLVRRGDASSQLMSTRQF